MASGKALDLNPNDIKKAMSLAPPCLIGRSTDKFFPYGPLNFRRAPNWPKAAPFEAVIVELLTLTRGRNILQTSMTRGVKDFVDSESFQDISKVQIETAAYAIRCIISQIRNHLKKSRKVPREHQTRFQKLIDVIEDDDAFEDDVMILEIL